jgi:putative thioredoxin
MSIFDIFKKNGKNNEKRLAIIEVTDDNFGPQVIQRSFKTAVMVDYWAAWCGPCRRLGPILEKLAEEPDQEFILAKLDTESNPRTAQLFQIFSIPAVKMFRNGAVIGQFTGALPEPVVRKFIKEMTEAEPPTEHLKLSDNPSKRLVEAEAHLKKGKGFEAFVQLNNFPESAQLEQAESLLPLARFLLDEQDGDALTGVDELDDAYQNAAESLRKRKPNQALEFFMTALEVGEEIDRPYTQEIVESLFALLGPDHKLTQEYRPRLSSQNLVS